MTRLLVPFGYNVFGTAQVGMPSGIPFGQQMFESAVAPFTGTFVWHCHILDHEENDMMHRYRIQPPPV